MAQANRDPAFENVYTVVAPGADNLQWFQTTTGYGDNADSGTVVQRQAQCQMMTGNNSDGDPVGLTWVEGTAAPWD